MITCFLFSRREHIFKDYNPEKKVKLSTSHKRVLVISSGHTQNNCRDCIQHIIIGFKKQKHQSI